MNLKYIDEKVHIVFFIQRLISQTIQISFWNLLAFVQNTSDKESVAAYNCVLSYACISIEKPVNPDSNVKLRTVLVFNKWQFILNKYN